MKLGGREISPFSQIDNMSVISRRLYYIFIFLRLLLLTTILNNVSLFAIFSMCPYCSKGETNVELPFPKCCSCKRKTRDYYWLLSC